METRENTPRSRRFNLGDGLILIGALALTLVVLRASMWFYRFPIRVRYWGQVVSGLMGISYWNFPNLTRRDAVLGVVSTMIDELLVQLLSSLLLGLTLVQPLICLRAPRPPFRDLVRQSGFVVCLSVIIATMTFVDLAWIGAWEVPVGVIPAFALCLLWPILGLPPWRKQSNWVDRLGRVVGWGWIVATVGETSVYYLSRY